LHLAAGTLANDVCTATAAVSTASLIFAMTRLRSVATRERLVKAGMGAAIVFLAQMVDVPLFGAVQVHAVGAAFLTLLAGPELAILGMTVVIATQALFLNDGGLAELGANVLNMGVVGVFVAMLAMRLTRSRVSGSSGLLVAAALASVFSIFAAVAAMSLELAFSGTPALSAFGLTMPAHAGVAAWEAVTTLALVTVSRRVGAIAAPAASPVFLKSR
jgi:cobalt/nickel transport system permease protein